MYLHSPRLTETNPVSADINPKAQKKMRLTRTFPVTFDIVTGHDILSEATELARLLWNDTHTLWRARCQEGDWFQTWYEVRDTLRPTWSGRLSDQCFSQVVHEFDSAMRSWQQARRTNPNANSPGPALAPRPLTSAIKQNATTIGPWTFRLALLGQEYDDRHLIVRVKPRPEIKMHQVKLIQVRPDGAGVVTYYINPPYQTPGAHMAGIDLGVYNLAAVAFQSGESTLYNGRALLDLNRYYAKRIAKCGPSIKPGEQTDNQPSPRSLAYRAKLGNLRRLVIHNLTSCIVAECLEKQVGTIVLGRLKHIRSRAVYHRNAHHKLSSWPFDRMTRQIIYKARAASIKVILVSEAYTSQTCHYCGQRGQRVKRGLFHCPHCDLTINADINGAFNILNKVSPVPICAKLGVKAVLPGLPSSEVPAGDRHQPASRGTGQAPAPPRQIGPTFVRRFDLPGWSLGQPSV